MGDLSYSKNASLQISEGKISAILSETETYSAHYSTSVNKYSVPNNCKPTLIEERNLMRFKIVGFSMFYEVCLPNYTF